MIQKKKLILLIAISLLTIICFSTSIFAETIVFKWGTKAEVKIIEKTNTHIKIKVDGTELVYRLEDIESIDGEVFQLPLTPKDSLRVSKDEDSFEEKSIHPKDFLFGILFIIFVYSVIFLYAKNAKIQLPISVAILGGVFMISGTQNIISFFVLKKMLSETTLPPSEGFIHFILMLVKLFTFFWGIFFIYLGISLVSLRSWARKVTLWVIALGCFLNASGDLLRGDSNRAGMIVLIYGCIYVIYFFGLNKKYFKEY